MQKNIVVCILLTLVTCGLYGIYWLYTLNEAALKANSQEWSTSSGIVILLMIVTCGIYTLYWNYKMGNVFETINGGRNNSLLFLILTIFGFQIVNYCIMQDDINKYMA